MERAVHRDRSRFQADPIGYVFQVLGEAPWWKQRSVLNDIARHTYVAVRAANNTGKTVLATWAALWHYDCFRNSITLTSATTWAQVEGQIWRGIHELLSAPREEVDGNLLKTSIERSASHFAMGISSNKPEPVAGYHPKGNPLLEEMLAPGPGEEGPYVLDPEYLEWFGKKAKHSGSIMVIFDEASGIEDPIWRAADGLMTSPQSRMLAQGNPIRSQGRFFDIFNPPHGTPIEEWPWRLHTVSALEVPESLIRAEWIRDMQRQCGRQYLEHPVYQARVLGVHPTESENQLVTVWMLQHAADNLPERGGGRHMGVDLSLQGSDSCVAVFVDNGLVRAVETWRKSRAQDTAARIVRLARDWGVEGPNVHVDGVGMGGPFVHLLQDAGLMVDSVDFGAQPVGDWPDLNGTTIQFGLRRDELFWTVRRALEEGQLCIPADPRYSPFWAELGLFKYKQDGKVRVTKKDEIKKLLGKSCDYADAIALAMSRSGQVSMPFAAVY